MEFLANLLGGTKGIIGDALFQGASNALSTALFGRQDRLSNADFQHYQNLADSGNPREIARQKAFLEGMAPSQATAYNTYQDATYGADTARQTDRIQSMSADLGMSPWELTGSSGAAPLPSPSLNAPQNNSGNFMSQLVPLKVAEMANKTQLATAQLQAATQLQTTKMQTDTQRYGTDVGADTTKTVAMLNTANGKLPVKQVELTAAQTFLAQAQDAATSMGTTIAINTDNLNTVRTLGELAAKTTIELPGYKSESNSQYPELIQFYRDLIKQNAGADPQSAQQFLNSVPRDQLKRVERDATRLAKLITDAAGGYAKPVTDFLGGKGLENFIKDVTPNR